MVFKPFSNLARQSISKHLVNGYAQSVVAATQSSYASTTLPLHKFNAHANAPAKLHHVFGSNAHNSGAGRNPTTGGGEGGVGASYAAQGAVDDKEERKYLFSKKILWSKAQHQQQQQQLLGAPQPMSETNAKERTQSTTSVAAEVDLEKVVEEAAARMEEVAVEDEMLAEQVEEKVLEEAEAGDREEGTLIADAADKITEQYNVQLQSLREQGRFEEVVAIFKHMLAEGVRPNATSYNSYLVAIVGLGPKSARQVVEVYRDMVRDGVTPNTATYSILLNFLATRAINNFTVVRHIERDAERFGVVIPSKKEIAAELKSEGALDTALELFYACTESQRERFSRSIYSALMQACSKYGKDDDMIRIAMHMDAHSIEPTTDIVRSMIRGFGRTGNIRSAVQTYNSWLELDYARDEALMDERYMIYRELIKAYMDCGDQFGALSFLERIVEVNQDASRIEWLAQAVIKGLVEDGDVPAAKTWATKLSLRVSNSKWLAKLLAKAADNGELEFTRALYNSIAFSAINYSNTLHALTNNVSTTLASSHNDLSHHQDLSANIKMQDSLEYQTAFRKLEELRFSVAECQTAALALCLREGNMDLARDLWSDLNNPKTSSGPDIPAALAWVTALFHHSCNNEALVVLKQFGDFYMNRYMPQLDQMMNPAFQESKSQALQEMYQVLLSELCNKGLLQASIAMDVATFADQHCGGLSSGAARTLMSAFDVARILGLTEAQTSLIIKYQLASMHASADGGVPQLAFDVEIFNALVDKVIRIGFPIGSQEVSMINIGVSLIATSSPQIAAKWGQYIQQKMFESQTMAAQAMVPMSPVSAGQMVSVPGTPVTEVPAQQIDPHYDPYWERTDVRASNTIDSIIERNPKHIKVADIRRVYRASRRSGRVIRISTVSRMLMALSKQQGHGFQEFCDEIYRNATVDTPLMIDYPFSKAAWIELMDSMIAACLNNGNLELAENYHQQLRNTLGAPPSANTFGLYVVNLRSAGCHDEATEALKVYHRALEEGVLPTAFMVNAVIGKLSKARRIDDCMYFWSTMRTLNLKLTSITYGTMINACTRVGDEINAEELFKEMEAAPNYRPRPAPYNTMIQFFVTNKRNRDKALFYYNQMKARDIMPTSHTFKLLIEAHATLENPDLTKAEAVLDTIREHGQRVESCHHAALILAKGKTHKDVAGALEHFHGVLRAGNVRPDASLYQAIVEVLVDADRVKDTVPIIQEMNARGMPTTPYIANSLIKGWAAENDIAMAARIYGGLYKKEPSTYEAMVRAYLSADDKKSAKRVADDMNTRGYPHAVVSRVLDLVKGVDYTKKEVKNYANSNYNFYPRPVPQLKL